jgi:hypothetical protein
MNLTVRAVVLLMIFSTVVFAQESNLFNASDPVTMRTRATVDIESYIFHNSSEFYALRLGYYYGLKNEHHLFGMSLPFVHTVFEGDYDGFENTSGFGDLKMSYLFVPFHKANTIGIERVTFSMDVSAPTGEYKLGRGAGTWLYKPGFIVTWRPGLAVALFPEVRFQFSGSEANSGGGSDGAPDPDDPEKDDTIQNLSFAFPAVVQMEDWNGWFSLNTLYTHSFSEQTDFLFLRMDLGKMIGKNTSTVLRITKFIAGQPRLNVVVQANVTFFMR